MFPRFNVAVKKAELTYDLQNDDIISDKIMIQIIYTVYLYIYISPSNSRTRQQNQISACSDVCMFDKAVIDYATMM